MSYFFVDIMTPYKVLAKDIAADSLHIPTVRGEINVLPGHTHIISQLETGILECHTSSGSKKFMVTMGTVKVLKKKVTLLVEVAERAEGIDVERARRALEKAHKRITGEEILDDEQLEKFRRKLSRAFFRIELGNSF